MEIVTLKDTPPWEWPAGTGAKLKEILRDPASVSAADSLSAAELAGDLVVMDDEMATLLLSIIENSAQPAGLRARAAISLGPTLEAGDTDGYDDGFDTTPVTQEVFDRVEDTLHKMYLQGGSLPKELRRRLLEAAVRGTQTWQKEAVRAAYKSPDPEWKLTAVFCMRWLEGFDKEILESLKSRDPKVHLEAVRAAGAREVEGAWRHIAGLISATTTEKSLLLTAIEAIPNLRPDDAHKILEPLTRSDDHEIAEAAREAIDEASLFGDDFDEDEDEDDLN